jgi:transglutaminase-like putative cysteine protease
MEKGRGLMDTLLQAARRFVVWVGLANLTTLLLTWTVVGSLVRGLGASIVGLDEGPLFVMGLVGVLLGWLLTGSRMHVGKTSSLFVASGFLVSTLWIARLGKPLVNLMLAGGYWFIQALRLERRTWEALYGLDTATLRAAWSVFGQASLTVISRMTGWLQALTTGQPEYDPLVVQLILGLTVWLLSGWADWWIRRRNRPLIGTLPAGALLAVFLAYSGASIYLVVIWIGCVVTLQALDNYAKWKHDWEIRHVGMAEIEIEWAFAVVGFALFAVMSAAIAPSVSIQKISERIERMFTPSAGAGEPGHQAFGVKPRPHFASTPLEIAQSTGLPNEHLLGSGPELSEKVVMWISLSSLQPPSAQVITSQPAQPPRSYYWRSLTYDQYNGRGWSTQPSKTERVPAGQSIAERLAKDNLQEIVQQHIQLAGNGDGLLYATGEMLAASEDYQIAWRTPGDLFGAEITARDYWVNSGLPLASPQQLRSSGNDYPDWIRKTYLRLPESLPQRVRNLALDLTATQPTPYDRALSIERYLRTIPYSLDIPIPPGDRDLVDYFIFDLKKGFCDYYASAMVVLARAAGLPSRMVVGYASGAYQPETGSFVVTEADAHSWPEVYFPGYGWVEFEPTGNRPEITRPSDLDLQAMQSNSAIPFPPPATKYAGNLMKLLSWAAISLGALLSLFLLWLIVDSWRLRLLPPLFVITLLYRRLYHQGGKLLGQPSTSDTPHEFMALFSQTLKALLPTAANPLIWHRLEEPLQTFVDLYARAIYSPHLPDDGEKSTAIEIWKTLQPRLWQMRIRRIFEGIKGWKNRRT